MTSVTISPSLRSQRTKQIALLAIFSALYIILRFIPFSTLIGATGGYLSFSDFLAPVIGILLGPYLGGLTVLIGNFGAIGFGRATNFPTLFGLADFLPDFVAVVSVGFLMRRKWIPAVVALNVGLLALFLVDPLTSVFVTIPGTSISIPFAWMHIAAIIVLISPLGWKAGKWIELGSKTVPVPSKKEPTNRRQRYYFAIKSKINKFFGDKRLAGGLVILVFIGTMMQHLTGNILFELSFGQIGNPPIIPVAIWPSEWTLVVFAYPVERTILIISAVLVGVPLIRTIAKNHFIKIGKQEENNSAEAKQPVIS